VRWDGLGCGLDMALLQGLGIERWSPLLFFEPSILDALVAFGRSSHKNGITSFYIKLQ
jgi:hypothetical protein